MSLVFDIFNLFPISLVLQMYLFIYNLTIQNLEGIQMNALMERENGVADGGIVGQTEVFLRGARGRSRMAVPVGEDFQALAPCMSQRGKLILRRKREVLWRVVDVLHPVVLCDDVALVRADAQQVAARLVGCVLLGLAD